jgi:hypothetical protein
LAGFTRFTGFSIDWTAKATKISGQATNFKTWLNTRTAELLTWLEDTFLAELESTTDGSSGADKIGMTKLTNYGSAAAATAQAQAEALDTAVSTHLAEKATLTTLGHIKIGSAGSIDAGGVYTPGGFTPVKATHDVSVTGAQAITGAGFAPRAVIIEAIIDGSPAVSIGLTMGTTKYCVANGHATSATNWLFGDGAVIYLVTGSGVFAQVTTVTLDSDGCTLTWIKGGSPTGTATLAIMFLR